MYSFINFGMRKQPYLSHQVVQQSVVKPHVAFERQRERELKIDR